MIKQVKYFVTIGNKKYFYSFRPYKDDIFDDAVFFKCEAASIAQPFLREDIPALLVDLPNLIIAEKIYQNKQKEIIRFRVAPEDKRAIEKKAVQKGYASVSSFLRDLALKA